MDIPAQGEVLSHVQGAAAGPCPHLSQPTQPKGPELEGAPRCHKLLAPQGILHGIPGPSSVPDAEGLPRASPRPRVLTPQQEQGGHQRSHRRGAHRRRPGHQSIPPSL
ncbi:hypothetical protein P7K49_021998 [Saguinus oedipus]|uniref:Uncharacterized protein n=1 Tax=Saguinus oedipus TaxID=9490 RepID=A0ABQ9UV47_SAGOE|nr:hypothetical protein P7K49_021998 [Saguinus oedipus]